MANFFRSLCITVSSALFILIPKVYKLFYDLAARHDLFSSDTIDAFSRNIYVLVSVVMLFSFAVKAIESIVNPDMLMDSKKGYAAVVKRSVIALALIVIVPLSFDLFYKFQDEVMSKSLIEKLIIGVAVDNGENTAEKSGADSMIASTALSSVLFPSKNDTCEQYDDSEVCNEYNNAMEDITTMPKLISDINEKDDDDEYILTYEAFGLLSIVVGIVVLYMLALFCIDTALRMIKMAFLEITAPVSIVAYIYGGNDILKKWSKETVGTAMSLFGRVAALAVMIFILSKLPEFLVNFNGSYLNLINLFIIIATLMFVKDAPSLIERVFGIQVSGKGGIAGRLGNMAGVGGMAKDAWTKMKNVGGAVAVAGLGAAGLATAAAMNPLFTAGAIGSGFLGKGVSSKASELKQKISNTGVGQQAGRFKRVASAGAGAGGIGKGIKAMTTAYKDDKLTKFNAANKQESLDNEFKEGLGIDSKTGKLREDKNAPVNSIANKDNPTRSRQAREQLLSSIDNDKVLSSDQKKYLKTKLEADMSKSNLEKLQSNHAKVSDKLNALKADAQANGNKALSDELTTLSNNFSNGKISIQDLSNSLQNQVLNGNITSSAAGEIYKDLNSMNHLIENAVPGSVIHDMTRDGNGNISTTAISKSKIDSSVEDATSIATAADEKLTAATELVNDSSKHVIERYKEVGEKFTGGAVGEMNKKGSNVDNTVQGPPVPSDFNRGSNNNNNINNNSGKTQNSTTQQSGGNTQNTTTQQAGNTTQVNNTNQTNNVTNNNTSQNYSNTSFGDLYQAQQSAQHQVNQMQNELLNRTYNQGNYNDEYMRGSKTDMNDVNKLQSQQGTTNAKSDEELYDDIFGNKIDNFFDNNE